MTINEHLNTLPPYFSHKALANRSKQLLLPSIEKNIPAPEGTECILLEAAITSGFLWNKSEEGFAYWAAIHQLVLRIDQSNH